MIFFNFTDNGWGDWSEWSTCDKHCGDGTQGRRRICAPLQDLQTKKALEDGTLNKHEITCHKPEEKATQICNNGPCNSVGWRKNKETGHYENLGQKHGQRVPEYQERDFRSSENDYSDEGWGRSGKIDLNKNEEIKSDRVTDEKKKKGAKEPAKLRDEH